MKKIAFLLLILGAVSLVHAGATDSILFNDSFDRSDNTDIDASSTGMSGTLSPMVYQESFEGSGVASSIQILSSQLNIAVGAGMSSLYLDHNLIDAGILSADGFSISMDVVSITSADDQPNRFGGFGVGNTRAEAQAAQDINDMDAPLRPGTGLANQGRGVSDFYIDLALDQSVRVWSNGDLLNTIPVGAASGTIKADFYLEDFNASSTVTALVYFNDDLLDVQTFTWDNTNENYLGISGRTAAAGVFLDNLEIATIYEDRAHNPSPDGTTLVPAGTVNLQWYKGKDAAGNPNPDIDWHYLYITDELIDGEPNFAAENAEYHEVEDTDAPAQYDFTVDNNEIWYWRVDESVTIDGVPSGPDDPNTITGYLWQLETERSIPVIDPDGNPVDVMRYPYNDPNHIYEGDAVFTCTFKSINDVEVKWYRASDPDNEINDPDFTANPGQDGTSYTATLTIADVEVDDEDAYHCEITMIDDPATVVVSDSASLGVRRKVAHWTLDKLDVVNGQYVDISDDGHNADPNIVPDNDSFTKTIDNILDGALDLTIEPLAAADSNDWSSAMHTGETTVSVWLYWMGPNGNWQGVVSNRLQVGEGFANYYIEIRQDNGNLQIGGIPGMGDLQIPPLPIKEWTHLAITARVGEVVIYINGEPQNRSITASAVPQNIVPLYFGALGRSPEGVLRSIFNGSMDDIQIYNYARANTEVADTYYGMTGQSVCLNLDGVDLTFDVAGGGDSGQDPDCQIGLADFAAFAQTWMNCGLYPKCQ